MEDGHPLRVNTKQDNKRHTRYKKTVIELFEM